MNPKKDPNPELDKVAPALGRFLWWWICLCIPTIYYHEKTFKGHLNFYYMNLEQSEMVEQKMTEWANHVYPRFNMVQDKELSALLGSVKDWNDHVARTTPGELDRNPAAAATSEQRPQIMKRARELEHPLTSNKKSKTEAETQTVLNEKEMEFTDMSSTLCLCFTLIIMCNSLIQI